jgi:hypothetical protein
MPDKRGGKGPGDSLGVASASSDTLANPARLMTQRIH